MFSMRTPRTSKSPHSVSKETCSSPKLSPPNKSFSSVLSHHDLTDNNELQTLKEKSSKVVTPPHLHTKLHDDSEKENNFRKLNLKPKSTETSPFNTHRVQSFETPRHKEKKNAQLQQEQVQKVKPHDNDAIRELWDHINHTSNVQYSETHQHPLDEEEFHTPRKNEIKTIKPIVWEDEQTSAPDGFQTTPPKHSKSPTKR